MPLISNINWDSNIIAVEVHETEYEDRLNLLDPQGRRIKQRTPKAKIGFDLTPNQQKMNKAP
jgi:hypothetical protein